MKGAIDNAELGNLTGLLDKIKPAVQATNYSGERSALEGGLNGVPLPELVVFVLSSIPGLRRADVFNETHGGRTLSRLMFS